ncbi:MAG: hypothetical protein K0R15_2296 [Clostridiales bacterium]|jgi:hypothetical protein|nr:hypothetical protein [Clostridiales bacterium]
MIINLNQIDQDKSKKIAEIRDMNSEVVEMYASYLTKNPCFITKDLINEIVNDCKVSEEYAYYVLLAAACGLDLENNKRDIQLAKSYFIPSIKKLDTKIYKENSYYKNIKIPEVKFGDWELKYEKYQPYEAFIYNDLEIDKDFREIPRLGFFDEEILFPAVLESGIEWMTITPNEIETMQPVVEEVEGKVITFGLGLGYFAYMVSEKEQVQCITIVEKNEEVIRLFKNYILPQFPHKEKVEIISKDAFEYAEKYMVDGNYDYAFVDLWHNASDGVDMYLNMKKLEFLNPNTKYLYWIEESLLSNLRWYVYIVLLDGLKTETKNNLLQEEQQEQEQEQQEQQEQQENMGVCNNTDESCQQEFERKINVISSCLKGKNIHSFDEITYYLGNSFLKKLATKL